MSSIIPLGMFVGLVIFVVMIIAGFVYGVWLLSLIWLVVGLSPLVAQVSRRRAIRIATHSTEVELSRLGTTHDLVVRLPGVGWGVVVAVPWVASLTALLVSDQGVPEPPRLVQRDGKPLSLFWTQEKQSLIEVWWLLGGAVLLAFAIGAAVRRSTWVNAHRVVLASVVAGYPGLSSRRRRKLAAIARQPCLIQTDDQNTVRVAERLPSRRLGLHLLSVLSLIVSPFVGMALITPPSSTADIDSASGFAVGVLPVVLGIIAIKGIFASALRQEIDEVDFGYLQLEALSSLNLVVLLILFFHLSTQGTGPAVFSGVVFALSAASHVLLSAAGTLRGRDEYLVRLRRVVSAIQASP